MRNSLLKAVLLLCVLGLFMISCTKDKDKDEDNTAAEIAITSSSVSGVWNCTELNYTGTNVLEFLEQKITTETVGVGYDIDFTFTISEKPNVTTSDGSYSVKLATTLMGQTTNQDIKDLKFTVIGSWSIVGNKMTIITGGESSIAKIVSLTATTLELELTDTQNTTANNMVSTVTTNSHLKFVK